MINGVQVLIQVDVGGEGDVGVVSRLEVCHAAGGDAEAAQHWGQADRDRRGGGGVNPQAGLIEEACIMTSEGSAEMERWNFEKKAAHVALIRRGWRRCSNANAGMWVRVGCVSCCQASWLSDDPAQAG